MLFVYTYLRTIYYYYYYALGSIDKYSTKALQEQIAVLPSTVKKGYGGQTGSKLLGKVYNRESRWINKQTWINKQRNV